MIQLIFSRYVGIACFCLILLCALFNMVMSVVTLLGSLLSSSNAKLVREELSEDSVAAKTNARLPTDDINEAEISKVIVSSAVEHDKDLEEDSEKETNDAEEDIVIVDDTAADAVLVQGIFFEIFGCLPIFFVIYWPLFLFLITKICKVAQIARISPRVAQPM